MPSSPWNTSGHQSEVWWLLEHLREGETGSSGPDTGEPLSLLSSSSLLSLLSFPSPCTSFSSELRKCPFRHKPYLWDGTVPASPSPGP